MRSYMTDHRTPLAWRHRDMTLQSGGGGQRSNHHHHHHHHTPRPPPSPSVTTTSSDEREEVPMVRAPPLRRPNSRGTRYHRDGHSQFSAVEPYHGPPGPFRNGGTLRSTRSVPALALATWDGEPCPVHGHGVPLFHHQHPMGLSNAGTLRRHGSLFDVRLPYFGHPPPPPPHFGPPSLQYPPPPLMDKKSFHGSMQMLGNPYMMPPMMRPRPFVIPAPAEPLPVRDPYKMRTPPASGYAGSKADDTYSVDQVCCKGHLIVLWIILAVVTIGVILGIVLGVTIA
ncbi:uncharacterized protein TNIN_120021 [Trichonephila inaurata madagascariensis]|uniref:Uncharacterized protein n=1 Tax=Trichonephila inaurata madagascariensis TaxID=2747483 RepID=A0A8X7BU38_9ARAC|nr:uncharacterized protein TNIN_120021 [Trichonephila inaurata madagascariensis]